jgi:RNA polymerase sigma factor (sigma-70 family)
MAMPDNEPADSALLREFLHGRSEAAFRQLTARHIDLVFGTAQRRTNDRGAAEEISQNVFLALAKKAAWLQSETSLAGWLHRTALLEAKQWWRGELRRRQREETAAQLETTMKTPDSAVPDLAGVLDDALLELREGDRQAVLLRYFEDRNHREIGAALGIGEDAARKRVDKALDQIAVFFRKRGHSVGGAAGVAALLAGSVQAAPAWLAVQVAGGVVCRAMPTGFGVVAKVLGFSAMQVVVVSLLLIGAPATWQTARLASARGEQRRLEALLGEVAAARQSVADDWFQLRRQMERVSNDVVRVETDLRKAQVAGDSTVDESDPLLFRWDEKADYVRVSKSVLKRIRFDGSKDPWGLRTGSAETFDAERKRISPTVLQALGLDAGQQAGVQELFVTNLEAYRHWTADYGRLIDGKTVGTTISNLPATMAFNDSSRAWMIPVVPEGGAQWREQFVGSLSALIGAERAAVLLRMAKDDGSMRQVMNQFGAGSGFVMVTPQTTGGLMVTKARVASGRFAQGNFNIPVSFGEVLSPVESPAFDEAAIRREITEKIPLFQTAFPDREVPPVSELVAKARQGWEAKKRSENRMVLEEPLPTALVDYLREWKAAHPDVPDSAPQSSKK